MTTLPAAGSTRWHPQVGVPGVALGVGRGRRAQARLEGVLQTEYVGFPHRSPPSLLWHPGEKQQKVP